MYTDILRFIGRCVSALNLFVYSLYMEAEIITLLYWVENGLYLQAIYGNSVHRQLSALA